MKIMMGRAPMFPVDLQFQLNDFSGTVPSVNNFKRLEQVRDLLNKSVDEKILKQQAAYKKAYDKKHNVHANCRFVEGDKVQYENARKTTRKGNLLHSVSLLSPVKEVCFW